MHRRKILGRRQGLTASEGIASRFVAMSTAAASLVAACCLAAPLAGQYTPPGTISEGDGVVAEEPLRERLTEARWRLGAVRLEPWLGLRDGSVVTTSTADGEEDTDFTVTVGAGLRAYLKTGRHGIFAAHALPEYVWWEENEDKRRLNGRFGAGFFGYFGRLDLELSLRREDRQGFFTSELQELTSTREDTARLAVDVKLAPRLSLLGLVALEDFDNQEEERAVFGLLDRQLERTRLGLAYRSPRGFYGSIGFEDSSLDFDGEARNLSNDGEAIFLELGYEGGRFAARAAVQNLELTPQTGSVFAPLDETVGSLETLWGLHRSLDLLLYGRRDVRYSISTGVSSVLAERIGARADLGLGESRLSVFAETGEDEFLPLAGSFAGRLDDVTALGANLGFAWRSLTFRLGVTHTEYDAEIDLLDRDVTTWTVSVEVLEWLRRRLRLGEGGGDW